VAGGEEGGLADRPLRARHFSLRRCWPGVVLPLPGTQPRPAPPPSPAPAPPLGLTRGGEGEGEAAGGGGLAGVWTGGATRTEEGRGRGSPVSSAAWETHTGKVEGGELSGHTYGKQRIGLLVIMVHA
jgi:hypothetical protein